MDTIKIRYFSHEDEKKWDAFVKSHPRGTFFHLIGWKNVIETTFGHKSYYLIAEMKSKNSANNLNYSQHREISNSLNDSGESKSIIVGVLPLFSIKSILLGRSLISIPFAAYGGVLADDDQVIRRLFERAKEIVKEENLDYLELRNSEDNKFDLPTKELYATFRREIYSSLEENLIAIPRKARRMIRQGEKFNLSAEMGSQYLKKFYSVFSHSYHRLGTPVFQIKFFNNLLAEFNDNCNILVIRASDGKYIAGVSSFLYKDQVLPYYAGSLFENRNLAPNDFMYWQLMKYACEKGYKLFDFGRSKVQTGSYNFKRHWGFEPKPLYYQYYFHRIKDIPNISPNNPEYMRKIELWKKLPYPLTKIIGPAIAKYLA
ncbi:hypothetical protein AMJ44_02130 [candidate division WOR-1 bacterium DG_54_3]|uniref:BioF2-like acetyltransferase domain-containing protein n=1 Tax=candidate division WOR-1 bacterium DG_54_3 TaxID=1703775 RepID=A0A0S7Y548_UNCSA|nr:MAG: hypothetical protein AMJ44_02130 [candidate division WOR-1 bacterium DG_54_3]